MSSSAALASAKKRRVEQRVNNQMPIRRVQQQVQQRQVRQQVQQQVQQQSTTTDSKPPKKLTPLETLTSHDKRLDRIENEFPQAVDQLNENISILSKNMDVFGTLSTKVASLEKTVDKENSDENMAFFRKKS